MADDYTIHSDDEWKEILKNHNVPYYPRNKDLEAGETYFKICEYFDGKDKKPKFLKNKPLKILKLERALKNKKRQLNTMCLTNFEKAQLILDIKCIESKLLNNRRKK